MGIVWSHFQIGSLCVSGTWQGSLTYSDGEGWIVEIDTKNLTLWPEVFQREKLFWSRSNHIRGKATYQRIFWFSFKFRNFIWQKDKWHSKGVACEIFWALLPGIIPKYGEENYMCWKWEIFLIDNFIIDANEVVWLRPKLVQIEVRVRVCTLWSKHGGICQLGENWMTRCFQGP